MFDIKKLLVPVDFSGNSAYALEMAITIAEKFSAEIVIYHAVDIPHIILGDEENPCPIKDYEKYAREQSRKQMDIFLMPYKEHKFIVHDEIEIGKPFEKIIRAARRFDADIIIMGTHGQSALKHILIGSVAEKVVRKAPCPVLTVKNPAHKFEMIW